MSRLSMSIAVFVTEKGIPMSRRTFRIRALQLVPALFAMAFVGFASGPTAWADPPSSTAGPITATTGPPASFASTFGVHPDDTCGAEKHQSLGGNDYWTAACESYNSSTQVGSGGVNDSGPAWTGHAELTGPGGIDWNFCNNYSFGECAMLFNGGPFPTGTYCTTLWFDYNNTWYDMARECASTPF